MIVFHGTSADAARSIVISMRVLVGIVSRWGSASKPMPRMYVTPDLVTAVSYARDGIVVGEGDDERPEGAVLKIDVLTSVGSQSA